MEIRRLPLVEKRPGTLARLAVDQVEHHVDTLGDFFEALGLVVDHHVSPERSRKLDMFRRDRRQHASAFCLGELNREMTDAARSAVDQNGLSSLELAVSEQALMRRLSCQRNGGSMNVIEPGGLVRGRALVEDHLLGVAAAEHRNHAEDLVADTKARRLRAACRDDSADGKRSSRTEGYLPDLILKSTGLTLAARTETRIWPASGPDCSSRSTRSMSLPPNS